MMISKIDMFFQNGLPFLNIYVIFESLLTAPKELHYLSYSDPCFTSSKFSSQNWTEKGVVSAKEDAPERRGFRDETDLRLGAIEAD